MAGMQTPAQKQAAEQARLAALATRNQEIRSQHAAEVQAARQKQDAMATNTANLARSISDLTTPAPAASQGWAPPQGQSPAFMPQFTPPPMQQGWVPPSQIRTQTPGLAAWAPPMQGYGVPQQGVMPQQGFMPPAQSMPPAQTGAPFGAPQMSSGIAGLGAQR